MHMQKMLCIRNRIKHLTIKDIRHIFSIMRKTEGMTTHHFFPKYGFTCGEFSICYVMNMCAK